MPLTANVGSNIKELRSVNASRHRAPKQILAIALNAAREHGAKIKPAPSHLSPREKLAKVVAKNKKA